MSLKTSMSLLLCLAILTVARGQNSSQPQDKPAPIGYQSAADAEQKKTLLLKDFHPVSMLHAPEHAVERAKYYVIDVHNHVNDAMRIDEHMPPERVLEIMNTPTSERS